MIPGHAIQKEEYSFAGEYSKALQRHDFKATLFVTGKCIRDHSPFWRDLASIGLLELGGHTYNAFQPWIIHKFFEYTLKKRYGPSFYQYLDIKRLVAAFRSIGIEPKAWRTHAYAGDFNTYQLLERFGFSIVSDKVDLGNLEITRMGKLRHIPITSIPDEKIAYFYFQGMPRRMEMEGKRVYQFIVDLISEREDMVLQLHPLCMKLVDDFRKFEKTLEMLSEYSYTSATITELANKISEMTI